MAISDGHDDGTSDPARVVAATRETLSRWLTVTDGLTEEQVRAPSALPDWTRGHVLAHLVSFVHGARRQVDHALRGELVEFYDGGRPGRSAEIEANAPRAAAELVGELRTATDALRTRWERVGPGDWDRRVTYRNGTLTDLAYCCWREAEIHLVDLDLGVHPSSWSAAFCRHAIGFLAPRAPQGVRLELRTPDGEVFRIGTGAPVAVHGELTDLTTWLAGRTPATTPTSAEPELPQLGPWP